MNSCHFISDSDWCAWFWTILVLSPRSVFRMKIHIVVALVLCNFYFITNGCNYERTDVYKLNIGENLRIRSGCTDEDEIRSIQWFFVLNGDSLYAQTPENVTSFAVPETGDLLLDSLKENNNGSYHFKVSEASSDKKQRSENIPVIVKCELFLISYFFKRCWIIFNINHNKQEMTFWCLLEVS